MAKYDWKQLENEYILSNCKSVSAFLREKKIKNNSSNRKQTKGWKEKRDKNVAEKGQKTIERVTEQESKKEAQKIVEVKDVANDLLQKIVQANNELNMHLVRNKTKTKKVKYDYQCNKPSEEIIEEKEEIKSYVDIINIKGLKELTSALKDLQDILINNPQSYELKKEKLKLEKEREEKDNW